MSGPSPIRLSTAELRGRTRALGGSMDSNTVKDRILGLGAGRQECVEVLCGAGGDEDSASH